jgi:hypothetical protein
MFVRQLAMPISLLAVLIASRPAAAQQTAAPLLAPPTEPAPSEVGSVVIPQVLLGTLTTFVGGIGLLMIASATNSDAAAYAAVVVTPGIGSLVSCKVGQTSAYYEGSCGPPLIGGYAGAAVLGVGMWYVGSHFLWRPRNDGDVASGGIEVAVGAAVGVIVGTAVGAAIGWHSGKHRRAAVAALAPKAPPPAALAAWTELGARTPPASMPRASGTLTVPLLSLRF